MKIPSDKKELKKLAQETIEICNFSSGQRQAQYRQLRRWIETGRANGGKSLCNRLYSHTDRLQSYLFSPVDLRFAIDFENHYPKDFLLQAEMAARVLTREFERKNIDLVFAEGVKVGLDYGACIIKALISKDEDHIDLSSRLVMPWMFGVYNETVTNLYDQEAVCETVYLTLPEVWRRVSHLPDAQKLYDKIKATASTNVDGDGVNNFFHQILSTSILQTDLSSSTSPMPGGIVGLDNNSSDVPIDAGTGVEMAKMHELYLWDDATGDYVTVQMFEPDILVAPIYKKVNLFCPEKLPYGLIQPNATPGYFWGRAEVVDMTEPQGLLSTWLDDVRRLMGVQYDKFLAFSGQNGITDEMYDEARLAGYLNLDQGSTVNDLTPKLPAEALQCIEMIIKFMEETAGFGNILSGQAQPGVRAESHASTLMKTASPRLRDRAILVERQCASFAENSVLSALESKSDKIYWTDPVDGADKEFLLSQLPEDRRVSVDSHSSSPIYEEDHKDLVGFLMKSQIIDGNSALDILSGVPMRDLLKDRYKEMQVQKQKMIEQHPEILTHGKKK